MFFNAVMIALTAATVSAVVGVAANEVIAEAWATGVSP
jgi:hypothetical protein